MEGFLFKPYFEKINGRFPVVPLNYLTFAKTTYFCTPL